MLRFRVIPFVLLAASPGLGQSQPLPAEWRLPAPRNMTLVDESGRGAVVFDCRPAFTASGELVPGRVSCTMYTVTVSHQMAPEELPAKRAQLHELVRTASDEMRAEIKQELRSLCETFLDGRSHGNAPLEMREKMRSVCNNPTRPGAFQELAEVMLELDTETCVISPLLPGVQPFTRTGDGRWLWNPGPTGTCSATTVGVLESSDGYTWTYTQTRLDADRSTDACRALELNRPVIWKMPRNPAPIRCAYVAFQ